MIASDSAKSMLEAIYSDFTSIYIDSCEGSMIRQRHYKTILHIPFPRINFKAKTATAMYILSPSAILIINFLPTALDSRARETIAEGVKRYEGCLYCIFTQVNHMSLKVSMAVNLILLCHRDRSD